MIHAYPKNSYIIKPSVNEQDVLLNCLSKLLSVVKYSFLYVSILNHSNKYLIKYWMSRLNLLFFSKRELEISSVLYFDITFSISNCQSIWNFSLMLTGANLQVMLCQNEEEKTRYPLVTNPDVSNIKKSESTGEDVV